MLLCLSVINIHQITEVHPRTSSARQSLETAQQGVRGLVQTAAACSMMLQSGHLQPAAWPRHLVSTLTEVCSCVAAQQLSRLHQYLSIKTCNCAATFHIQLPGTVM